VTLEAGGFRGVLKEAGLDNSGAFVGAYPPYWDIFRVHARSELPFAGIESPSFWVALEAYSASPPIFDTDAMPTALELARFDSMWFSFESVASPGPRSWGRWILYGWMSYRNLLQ
jgi:hypothetical protein